MQAKNTEVQNSSTATCILLSPQKNIWNIEVVCDGLNDDRLGADVWFKYARRGPKNILYQSITSKTHLFWIRLCDSYDRKDAVSTAP